VVLALRRSESLVRLASGVTRGTLCYEIAVYLRLVPAATHTVRADKLTLLPDRFNDAFGDRGWIISEAMNFELATACVVKAEGGDVDGAEPDLIDTMTLDAVKWNSPGSVDSLTIPWTV
jgi:hypothetical protein